MGGDALQKEVRDVLGWGWDWSWSGVDWVVREGHSGMRMTVAKLPRGQYQFSSLYSTTHSKAKDLLCPRSIERRSPIRTVLSRALDLLMIRSANQLRLLLQLR